MLFDNSVGSSNFFFNSDQVFECTRYIKSLIIYTSKMIFWFKLSIMFYTYSMVYTFTLCQRHSL